MTDETLPQFPQYPALPPGARPDYADRSQAKPLQKIIRQMFRHKPKPRVSNVKKKVARRSGKKVRWL